MKHLSLAARYRPQTFADVAGQPLAAVALSRAAVEGRIAPAYLLSGTRGVGKTTIARIFAKALNCEHAPIAEPCNECLQCRHVTAGNHVDVSEIDAASNTGVDDVRALRENIGFLPMEGRYKVFIVDEAHMLSRSAFNALLKTLEEPPAHTVFIFATTEVHKFPATIISRCQHFVFRHLSGRAISEHLAKVLTREGVEYEEGAVRLLATRAAGSVRDGLSLLDQSLALGNRRLSEDSVRESLGLAGAGMYASLLDAIAGQDCKGIVDIAEGLLSSGVDMGFFTRELGSLLRNLFLVRQAGEAIITSLGDITQDDRNFLLKHAPRFSASHLHAAWQMALDRQRSIAQSPEPGAALELLLINLALLPQLLPVGSPLIAKAQSGITAAPAPAQYQKAAIAEDWKAFCEFCTADPDLNSAGLPLAALRLLDCVWADGKVVLRANQVSQWQQVQAKWQILEDALKKYCGGQLPEISFSEPPPAKSQQEMLGECENKPEIQLCREILGATITECVEKKGTRHAEHE